MADFTQSSKYNKNANMDSVKFGADAPLLETELNELQDIQNEARADVVRESTHSGFTTLGGTRLHHTPNTIRLRTESTAFVNGYKITIPATTYITLPEPPTKDFIASNGRKGWREDLVFLEVWREEIDHTKTIDSLGRDGAGGITNYLRDNRVGVETSRRTQLKYRIRSVSDIDFTTAEEGVNLANARGALATESTTKFTKDSKDVGMYRATVTGGGVGNLVYAIPMFKVERRNSGEYSVNNANGAYAILPPYTTLGGTSSTIPEGETRQITYPFDIANRITVGERLHRLGGTNPASAWRVISIDSPNTITVESLSSGTHMGSFSLYQDTTKFFGRPDRLYNNIIADRDIIDLRHKVSLTGFDYQQLLEENFDKLLRGELQTKERTKMKKTYFGIPKTPIDSNTVFYASFDGTTVAEVGGSYVEGSSSSFIPSPTGLSLKVYDKIKYNATLSGQSKFTIDFNLTVNFTRTDWPIIIRLGSSGKYWAHRYNIYRYNKPNTLYHNRLVIDLTVKTCKWFINGKLYSNRILSDSEIEALSNVTEVTLGYYEQGSTYYNMFNISDLHISNIDRGDNFATLPQDFRDGYADIVPAFNSQRDYFADPLTSQYTTEIIKASGTNEKQITTTQATSGVWASGDTIRVKGLTGEILSGVIDSASPTIKFMNGTTLTNVTGTWSGLGTNEMTFTIGTTTGLTNHDIQIEYSCNMIAGQGQVPVYNEVLQGEINGKKLIPQSSVTIVDDFKGKVMGSVSANPHKAFRTQGGSTESTSLLNPSSFTMEADRTNIMTYNQLSSLDGETGYSSATTDGGIPQQLFSFNIIEIVERKYGKIPAIDKVQWLRGNLSAIRIYHYVYGSCPTGNKCRLALCRREDSIIADYRRHSEELPSVLVAQYATVGDFNQYLFNDGFTHTIVYTDPTDGETASAVYTDYVDIEVTLKTTAFTDNGYKVLAPKNNRAREDKAGILLVRPETKEVMRYPLGEADNNSGVKVWGDYVPYQGVLEEESWNPFSGSKLITDKHTFITTEGTGGVHTKSSFNDVLQQVILRCMLPSTVSDANIIPINIELDGYKRDSFIRLGNEGIVRSLYGRFSTHRLSHQNEGPTYRGRWSSSNANEVFVVKTPNNKVNYLTGDYHLVVRNQEIYIIVATLYNRGDFVARHAVDAFKLQGRPLIKGGN